MMAAQPPGQFGQAPNTQLEQIIAATRGSAAAALAGGMIAASGRAHSIEEAMELYQNIYMALYPSTGQGRYQAFAQKKDEIVKKVHA